MMKRHLIILILVTALSAQDIQQREYSILEKNLELYKTGKYEKAEQNFSLIITRLPNSVFITTNYLLWAKCKYKLQDYKGALKMCGDFLTLFPDSEYRDDILLLQGNTYYRLNRYKPAVQSWFRAIENSSTDLLVQKAGYQVTKTLRYKFNSPEFRQFNSEVESSNARLLFEIARAENEMQKGNKNEADNLIQNALAEFPGTKFTRRAESLLIDGEISPADMSLALLLPLSGANEKIGNEIKEGFEFALQEYNLQKNSGIKVISLDYGEETVTALRHYQRLSKNNNVLAVLGPIENDISAACAAVSDYESLPIVSPTATDPDLTLLTDKFFQLNSSVTLRAEILARYATDSLKLKRFATFAPLDNHFIKMVAKFAEAVQAAGGEIIGQEWYYPGDQDVNKQFMNLKRIGLRMAFADSLLKISPELRTEQVDSLYKKYVESQVQKNRENYVKIDSADIAVKSIDGVFIPIFKEDLKFIAPQIAYSNIQARYFGNGDWYEPEELKKNKNYLNGLIFIADGYLNEENWDYKKFKNDYRMLLKKTATMYNIIGYDCGRFMLRALRDVKDAAMSRSEYLQNLRSHEQFNGLYRNINLNDDQCNLNLRLLKYIYGQIIPLN
jgi:ABC-type branched-subunit amino acid transport system substrate-binding protein